MGHSFRIAINHHEPTRDCRDEIRGRLLSVCISMLPTQSVTSFSGGTDVNEVYCMWLFNNEICHCKHWGVSVIVKV